MQKVSSAPRTPPPAPAIIEQAARAWVEASKHAGKEVCGGGFSGISADELISAEVGPFTRATAGAYRAYEVAVHARAREMMGNPPERAARTGGTCRIGDFTRTEIRRLSGEGWTAIEVARHFGCSVPTVYNVRRAG